MQSQAAPIHCRLTALLGPTNTGKTHRAITRMLEHDSGMIGLPLRLLAQEVYDRVASLVGQASVALVTGEEKRVGRQARFWVCTVEAMPTNQEVDFLAVDEIQLAAHPTRGHVFTERLLKARGRLETWFLGSATMLPMIRRALPTAQLETQPRLSRLRGKGQSKLTTLPRRSAVVAFGTDEVYRIAERVRRRKGGTAVVLGALSPRARNAQVALYESGEVDHLVATDAIGMGLNLSLKHVAFAGLCKFDGKRERPLEAAELAQIAGRAGRHLEDGSFGTLAPVRALSDGLRLCIEEHRFESVRRLVWRNDDLCLDGVDALIESLEARPDRPFLQRLVHSSDLDALRSLSADPEVRRRAWTREGVAMLWQACQIPDYRKWMPQLHANLVKEVFLQLSGPSQALDEDWLARGISRVSDTSGDLDALTARVTASRTWTYLCNQSGWTRDPRYWKSRARRLEERLSDALHDRLVDRFVQRARTSTSAASTSTASAATPASPTPDAPFAALLELRQRLTPPASTRPEARVESLVTAAHERFALDASGRVLVDRQPVAHLSRGTDLLHPEVKITLDDVSPGQRLRLSRRLLAWSRDLVGDVVASLKRPPEEPWSPAARGLIYQLEQNLGSLDALPVRRQLSELRRSDRQSLETRGIVMGRNVIHCPISFEPKRRLARLALVQAFEPRDLGSLAVLERVSFVKPPELDPAWLAPVGFLVFGGHAVRADLAQRVSERLWAGAATGPFTLPPELAQWLGCSRRALTRICEAMGFRVLGDGRCLPPKRKRPARRAKRRRRPRTLEPRNDATDSIQSNGKIHLDGE